jgi:hypothetical protein
VTRGIVSLSLFGVLASVGCARHRPSPSAQEKDATPAATSRPVPPAPAAPNPYTALGICNRIVASGSAVRCRVEDGDVSTVTFETTPHHGAGMVFVADDDAQYRRVLNSGASNDGKMAISDHTHVIVTWFGGDALIDAKIRLAVAQL